MGELAADRGADLRDLLDRGEAVEARKQRVVERRGDRERRQRAGKLVAVARVREQARLEHRLGQLLDEQGHAVGLGDDLRGTSAGRALAPTTRSTMRRALAAAEPGERQRADVRLARPGRG